jgi:hypothetical protein
MIQRGNVLHMSAPSNILNSSLRLKIANWGRNLKTPMGSFLRQTSAYRTVVLIVRNG